jgi:hypothetical protein
MCIRDRDVDSVTTAQRDFVVKAQVVTNERSIARANASGETLVVRVAQADNGAGRSLLSHVDLEKAEVTLAEASSGVQFLHDRKVRRLQLLAEHADEIGVTDRLVRIGGSRRADLLEIGQADGIIFATADAEVEFSFHFVVVGLRTLRVGIGTALANSFFGFLTFLGGQFLCQVIFYSRLA